MSDINLEYKINLRNKYLNKIIKNFKEVNSSLELLNNFNQKINRQYGGTIQETFDKTSESIYEMTEKISNIKKEVDSKIEDFEKASIALTQSISELNDNVALIPANNKETEINTSKVDEALDKINKII